MSKTLEEFMDSKDSIRLLVKNLRTNLDVLTDLDEEDQESLMRTNMIMVRQCLESFRDDVLEKVAKDFEDQIHPDNDEDAPVLNYYLETSVNMVRKMMKDGIV